jgi:hypothetical protein
MRDRVRNVPSPRRQHDALQTPTQVHPRTYQAAIDDIRVLLDGHMFRVPSFQIRGVLDRHGV